MFNAGNSDVFSNPITGKYADEPTRAAFLGRPTREHHVNLEAPHHASNLTKFKSWFGFTNEHHYFILDAFRYGIKGAVVYGLLGVTLGAMMKNDSNLALRKFANYVQDNNFGLARYFSNHAKVWVAGGFGAGVAYHAFFNCFWFKDSQRSKFYDVVTGNMVYWSFIASCAAGPRFWWAGMYAGFLFGMFQHMWVYGNFGPNRYMPGFYIQLPGKSDEERKEQQYRDVVDQLGRQHYIKYNVLSRLY